MFSRRFREGILSTSVIICYWMFICCLMLHWSVLWITNLKVTSLHFTLDQLFFLLWSRVDINIFVGSLRCWLKNHRSCSNMEMTFSQVLLCLSCHFSRVEFSIIPLSLWILIHGHLTHWCIVIVTKLATDFNTASFDFSWWSESWTSHTLSSWVILTKILIFAS